MCADGERIEPDAAEQAAIARKLWASKTSLRGVARALEARRIRSRTGRTFAPVQIRRMVG